jgi:hypothetical protein
MSLSAHKEKSDYLQLLFKNTYMKDVIDRHKIRNDKHILDDLANIISSAVGSLTNPKKLSDTFKTIYGISINSTTIDIGLVVLLLVSIANVPEYYRTGAQN